MAYKHRDVHSLSHGSFLLYLTSFRRHAPQALVKWTCFCPGSSAIGDTGKLALPTVDGDDIARPGCCGYFPLSDKSPLVNEQHETSWRIFTKMLSMLLSQDICKWPSQRAKIAGSWCWCWTRHGNRDVSVFRAPRSLLGFRGWCATKEVIRGLLSLPSQLKGSSFWGGVLEIPLMM